MNTNETPPTPAVIAPSAETASETPRCDKTAWEQDCNYDVDWQLLAEEIERELTQAQADLRAAQQALDAAREDTRLLDWLDSDVAAIPEGNRWWVDGQPGQTLRAAISAAEGEKGAGL